jgi:DNA-binding transcriptional LysR family regulator
MWDGLNQSSGQQSNDDRGSRHRCRRQPNSQWLRYLRTRAPHDDAKSPWARRRITLAEWVNEPWILQTAPVIRSLIDEAFRNDGLQPPREKVSTLSMHIRSHLVATGRYLTILPLTARRHNAAPWSLKALPVDLGIKPIPPAIITPKNRTLSPVVNRFIACAHEVAKSVMEKPRRPEK